MSEAVQLLEQQVQLAVPQFDAVLGSPRAVVDRLHGLPHTLDFSVEVAALYHLCQMQWHV